MNIELMKKWIAALRSGDYEQGIGALRNDFIENNERVVSKFCCLGVLCDIVKNKNDKWEYDGFTYQGITQSSFLPEDLAAELGLTNTGAVTERNLWAYWNLGGKTWHTLLHANDHFVPFSDIADELERYLTEYASKNDIQLR